MLRILYSHGLRTIAHVPRNRLVQIEFFRESVEVAREVHAEGLGFISAVAVTPWTTPRMLALQMHRLRQVHEDTNALTGIFIEAFRAHPSEDEPDVMVFVKTVLLACQIIPHDIPIFISNSPFGTPIGEFLEEICRAKMIK